MEKVDIPKPGQWPGVLGAFKLMRPPIKARIWDYLSVIGIGIILYLVLQIILSIVLNTSAAGYILRYAVDIVVSTMVETSVIAMYFASIKGEEMSVREAISYGSSRLVKMIGLIIVIDVILLASFILLIIPFFFILPRIYIAPYFLVGDNLNVNQAIAASWHLTKGHAYEFYAIIGIDVSLAIFCITIIGIPFAIYWGIINTGSFALLVRYIAQDQKVDHKSKLRLK